MVIRQIDGDGIGASKAKVIRQFPVLGSPSGSHETREPRSVKYSFTDGRIG
jgi:hypothetical protein